MFLLVPYFTEADGNNHRNHRNQEQFYAGYDSVMLVFVFGP